MWLKKLLFSALAGHLLSRYFVTHVQCSSTPGDNCKILLIEHNFFPRIYFLFFVIKAFADASFQFLVSFFPLPLYLLTLDQAQFRAQRTAAWPVVPGCLGSAHWCLTVIVCDWFFLSGSGITSNCSYFKFTTSTAQTFTYHCWCYRRQRVMKRRRLSSRDSERILKKNIFYGIRAFNIPLWSPQDHEKFKLWKSRHSLEAYCAPWLSFLLLCLS